MAELTPQERLQPSLLDRLTDDEPQNRQEGPDKRVLSVSQLRASVLRDLSWLFNSTRLMDPDNTDFVEAAHSVVNFGLPGLAGFTASSVDLDEVEQMLAEAIQRFEPRILKDSLKVRAQVGHDQMNHNALAFELEGDLWADPVPLRLLLKTQVDLETGHVQVLSADRRR
ncbi:MAG: type VI secretion system baseplate subunit TssE [Gammaproteobacteria bacterium]|nr:type VI secretion system baseplate subunit TssE [Gammaproteobacteria bacterium]